PALQPAERRLPGSRCRRLRHRPRRVAVGGAALCLGRLRHPADPRLLDGGRRGLRGPDRLLAGRRAERVGLAGGVCRLLPPQGEGRPVDREDREDAMSEAAVDLDAMTKEELLAHGQELGITPMNHSMTKEEIRAGIDAYQAGGEAEQQLGPEQLVT